jgi:hypothetical protein
MHMATSEIPTLFPHWSRRFLFGAAAVLFALLPHAAMAALPPVVLVENHGEVLVHWVRTGVRGAVAVNVDAHDDCAPIPPQRADKLQRLLAAGNVAAIGRANSFSDSGLYCWGDWISAAYALGIAREAVWVASQVGAKDGLPWVHPAPPVFPVRICSLESLPELKGPVLLTVDADCVPPFANYRGIDPVEAVRRIGKTLRAVPWDVKHVSVCFSCDGGYLPITLRWVGNALQEAFEGKDPSRTNAPWPLLAKVEEWRRSLPPRELVRRVRPLVQKQPKDPWLRVYLADALFRADDVPGALAEGKTAARLDPGCCRILPEIGGQLADAGHLDEAERFLAAAPAVVNIAAELALAQALDRAGRTAEAIEHYSRNCKQAANYGGDLLIGYGYERLGDTTRARQHYLHAVSLLAGVSEMPAFPDLAPSVAAAERFLRANGYHRQALALRQDQRLAEFFVGDKDTGGTAGH